MAIGDESCQSSTGSMFDRLLDTYIQGERDQKTLRLLGATSMKVKELFKKDIFRTIDGVVKADRLDESTVWQELDEFVVTREIEQHFRGFFGSYFEAIHSPRDAYTSGRIRVWVSGFFGSGKSHFIKIISYLLKNAEHHHNGETARAIDFFENKVKDATLFALIKRAAASDTDVVLFNIDSRADVGSGNGRLVNVFLKAFNEMQGYSPYHPHIALIERYLDEEGKLATFHVEFRNATGHEWAAERGVYEFNRDEVVAALSATLGRSKESCEKWIDKAEENSFLTVENFCKWVQDYLDRRGPDHRIIFLADDVGQFIAGDTYSMHDLRAIAERFGRISGGRASLVAKSHEKLADPRHLLVVQSVGRISHLMVVLPSTTRQEQIRHRVQPKDVMVAHISYVAIECCDDGHVRPRQAVFDNLRK